MPVANEETTMEGVLKQIMELPYDNLYVYPVIDSYSKDRTEEIIRVVWYSPVQFCHIPEHVSHP